MQVLTSLGLQGSDSPDKSQSRKDCADPDGRRTPVPSSAGRGASLSTGRRSRRLTVNS